MKKIKYADTKDKKNKKDLKNKSEIEPKVLENKYKKSLEKYINSYLFNFITSIITVYTLFGDDLR